jgi:hypothetical protein
MKTPSDLTHELRCATKRTDLPDEIVRLISEAYEDIELLRAERDEARRRICETTEMTNPNDDCYVRLTPQQIADHYGWDCYKEDGK